MTQSLSIAHAGEQRTGRKSTPFSPTLNQRVESPNRKKAVAGAQTALLATVMSTPVHPPDVRVDAEKIPHGAGVSCDMSKRPPQIRYWQFYDGNTHSANPIKYKIVLHSGWTLRHTATRPPPSPGNPASPFGTGGWTRVDTTPLR